LAKQNVSVRLEHYWKLAHVRRSFAEFKWSVEQLEEDDDSQCDRDYERIEAAWNRLVRAVDALLATIPVKSLTSRGSSKQSSACGADISGPPHQCEESLRLVLGLLSKGSQTLRQVGIQNFLWAFAHNCRTSGKEKGE